MINEKIEFLSLKEKIDKLNGVEINMIKQRKDILQKSINVTETRIRRNNELIPLDYSFREIKKWFVTRRI